LAALLHRFPRAQLRQSHLIVSPTPSCAGTATYSAATTARHPARNGQADRPPTAASRPSSCAWFKRTRAGGYRRVHGELAALGIKVALRRSGRSCGSTGSIPRPTVTAWATFLHSQAHAILAADFFEIRTLTGARLYVFAVIEHATRGVRVLGATAHPIAAWTTQLARNLVMDLQDAGATVKYMIRDRDSRYTTAFDADGQRTAYVVFDLREPAQMPQLAEPLFRELKAKIDWRPVMNREDLQEGLARLPHM